MCISIVPSFNSSCILCLGTEGLIVLDFFATLLLLFAALYSGMQAESTATCCLLADLPVSLNTNETSVLKHAHVFLVRDLRLESLWTRTTSKTCIPRDSVGKAASSSSNNIQEGISILGESSYDPIEIIRPTDIANNVEFFMGPPGPLQARVPLSRPFSKVGSLANVAEYVHDWPEPLAKAESASSGSGLVRKRSRKNMSV